MPGTAASHMIFFIASIIVATSVAGVFMVAVLNLSKNVKEGADIEAEAMNTRIIIINDPSAMPYNNTTNTLVLYVKSTGSTLLDKNLTRVLVDGNYSSSDNLTFRLLDGATVWGREVTLEITVGNCTLASGDHQVKVIVQYGKSTSLKFKIP